MQAVCYQIDPLALADDDATLGAMVLRWTAFWANWSHPVRLFVDLVPQRYPVCVAQIGRALAPLERAQRLQHGNGDAAASSGSWRRRWLIAQRTHLDDLHADPQTMCVRQYLVTWVPDDFDPDAVQASVERGLLVPIIPTPLPRFWRLQPHEQIQSLLPEHPGDPFMTVLMAHTLKGDWTPLSLHALLHLNVRLTLALDV